MSREFVNFITLITQPCWLISCQKILLTAALFVSAFWLKNLNLIIQLFVCLFVCAQTIFRIFNFLRFLRITYTIIYGWKFFEHEITPRWVFSAVKSCASFSTSLFVCFIVSSKDDNLGDPFKKPEQCVNLICVPKWFCVVAMRLKNIFSIKTWLPFDTKIFLRGYNNFSRFQFFGETFVKSNK